MARSSLWFGLTAAVSLAAAGALQGCIHASTPQPAVLVEADAKTLNTLRTVLAAALGRGQVVLGPEDLTTTSRFSVLPPPLGPLETRSVAIPTSFVLMTRGGLCFVQGPVENSPDGNQPAAQLRLLEGVACRQAGT
jgi:hypothetical protein